MVITMKILYQRYQSLLTVQKLEQDRCLKPGKNRVRAMLLLHKPCKPCLMWGSCHFDRASNFECLFWFFWIFSQPTLKSNLKEVQFTQNYLFWVKAPLWYLKGALNFKTRHRLKNITITNIQNSTLSSSFDALSKWHDPDLRIKTWADSKRWH